MTKQAARQRGILWGGSRKRGRKKVPPEQIKAIRHLKNQGEKISAIARIIHLSRLTIYQILARQNPTRLWRNSWGGGATCQSQNKSLPSGKYVFPWIIFSRTMAC